jgi:hypothetical protein
MPRATIQLSFQLPPGVTADHAADYLMTVTRTWLNHYEWLIPDESPRNIWLRVEVIEEPKI